MTAIDSFVFLKIAAVILALSILALSSVICFKNSPRSRRKRKNKKKGGKRSTGSPATSDEADKGSIKDEKRSKEMLIGSFETFTLGGASTKVVKDTPRLQAPAPTGPSNPKEAQIMKGMTRNKTDYPTMEDVISDWDEPAPAEKPAAATQKRR